MKLMCLFILSLVTISSAAFACDINEAREEAKQLLTRKYGKDNHVFVSPPMYVEGTRGKDIEIQFSVLSKELKFFELGDIGSIFIEEANECHARPTAVSSTLLK